MGERKVLNKYYPPDFDPAKLPRGQRGNKDAQMKVRMMLAMSVRCSTCGNYMYKGTKFNMRMEDVVGEDYLGIRIFRFYFHCKNCGAEITMKTDPKNSDYAMEQGATRNYEPWREKEKTVTEAVAAREEEERGNAMKALENRTLDSKKEMDIMDALEELMAVKGQHNKVSAEEAIAAIKRQGDDDADALSAQDEEIIAQLFSQRATQVKRLDESEANAAVLDGSGPAAMLNEHWDGGAGASAAAAQAAQKQPARPPPEAKPPVAPRLAVRPRFAVKPKQPAAGSHAAGQGSAAAPTTAPAGNAGGGSADAQQQSLKRPPEGQDAAGAEPAAKRSAVTASDGGSPAASDGAATGLPGLLGDYGSDDSKNS